MLVVFDRQPIERYEVMNAKLKINSVNLEFKYLNTMKVVELSTAVSTTSPYYIKFN